MTIFYILMFFLGAVFASFINATIYRIEKKYKYPAIFVQSSHCESCKHKLSWVDLFPIFGFIWNKGKCKYCGKPVNIYYPISELLLGLGFLLFSIYSLPFFYFIILLFLFVLSTYDLKEMGIPKMTTNIFIIFCVLIFLFFSLNPENLILPLIILIFFLLLNLVKKSFGIGDILVIVGLGILMTQGQYVSFFWLSVLISLVYAIVFSIVKRVNLKGMKVPMIPFISIAFVFSVVYGGQLWGLILKLIG